MTLINAKIISSDNLINEGWIEITDKIISINSGKYSGEKNESVIDCQNKIIIPSFIDIHTHGGYGSDFTNVTSSLKEILNKFASEVISEGVTDYCFTTVSASKEELDNIFAQIGALKNDLKLVKNATLIGIYLEGPFISQKYKGAHQENLLAKPQIKWIQEWNKISNNSVKVVAIAPELDEENQFIKFLNKENIIASFAHSNANYLETKSALDNGINHVTHFYNAMNGLQHRSPGAVTAILLNKDVTVELICDGVHIDLSVIELTYRIKGADKVIAVTDSVSPKGLPDSVYTINNRSVTKAKNKITLLNDNETIFGSSATMLDNFKNLLSITSNWNDTIKMTSLNAAKKIGIDNYTGDIKINNLANLLVLDQDMNLELTIHHGEIVYRRLV